MWNDLNGIVARFPTQHIAHCFAYGSGVFRQSGRTDRAMVDMIFVVDDTPGFHRDNLAANPGHYSSLRGLGPGVVSAVQTRYGANVYFNTHVRAAGVTFKYGVIDAADFRRDLRTWRTLYTAGRLHKPVLTLRDGGDGFGELIARNLECAASAALLQLPETFAEGDLYAAIAGLSYSGDFRMIVGEDKNKVANIVRPQIDRFRSLYGPVLEAMGDAVSVGPSSTMEQDKSADGKLYHLQRLPEHLKNVLLGDVGRRRGDDDRALLNELARRDDVDRLVRDGVRRIVFYSSLAQSVKGIPTAGLLKSVVYCYEKLNKMVKSMFA